MAKPESGDALEITADVALVSIGRMPYTDGLNLEAANVQKNERGCIEINNQMQTSQRHIYAIGDVVDGPMLAHKASKRVAVAEKIAGHNPSLNYLSIPCITPGQKWPPWALQLKRLKSMV